MKFWILDFGFRIRNANTNAIIVAASVFVFLSGAYAQAPVVEIKSEKPAAKTGPEAKAEPEKKPDSKDEKADPKTEEADKALEEQSLAQRLQALEVRERLAQLMLVTLEGTPGPNATDREFLLRYAPGGVIIPKVLYPLTASDYITKLRNMPLEAMTGIPMLIGTNLYSLPRPAADELPTTFVPMPSLLALAAANDPDITQRVSMLAANHLKAMGFNFHLGPSLTFAPTLPEIKGSLDCLGSDPNFVANSGCAILKTFEDNGILALPMGFPGGALNKKGKGPAVLLTPAALLEQEDLLPFKRAIEQGTSIIHVGNILTPTLSSDDLPASMSPAVMRDLLREKLGFKGVIVAGPMDAPEVVLNYDPSVAAEKSLAAGADMLLWNQAGRRVMRAVDQIVAGIAERRIPQETIDAALERVMRLKEEKELAGRPMPVPKEAEALSKMRELPKEVYEIERRSIALVQNRGDILPLNKTKSMPVGITGVVGVDPLKEALTKYLKHVSSHEIATAKHGGEIYDFEIDRITKHISGLRTMILILTPDIRTSTQARLIAAVQARGVVVVAVLVGYPDTLPKISGADAIVLSYCRPHQMDLSMKAVADVLVGQAPIGVSPYLDEIRTTVGKTESYSVLDVVRAPSGMLPVTIEPPFVAGLSVPYDPTFSLTKTLWEFGDGSKSKEIRAEHAFKAAGRYPITLTVEDKKDHSTTRTFYAVVE